MVEISFGDDVLSIFTEALLKAYMGLVPRFH